MQNVQKNIAVTNEDGSEETIELSNIESILLLLHDEFPELDVQDGIALVTAMFMAAEVVLDELGS